MAKGSGRGKASSKGKNTAKSWTRKDKRRRGNGGSKPGPKKGSKNRK